jgi:hypothetical protein
MRTLAIASATSSLANRSPSELRASGARQVFYMHKTMTPGANRPRYRWIA